MRKLLMTSAMVVPLMAVPVIAQETAPVDDQQDGTILQQEAPATGAAGDDLLQDDTLADDPAAEPFEDEAVADDPAAEPVEDDTLADDPAAQPSEDDTLADVPAAEPIEDDTLADDPAAEPIQDETLADDPAAEPIEDETVADDPAAAPANAVVTDQAPDELRGDWVIGTTVRSPQDETIGQIEDVIIDEVEGRISAAVLSVGGFLGFGAKNIAVDWNELQIGHDGQDITLALTREEADAAPEYNFREQAAAPAPAGDPAMTDPAPLQ